MKEKVSEKQTNKKTQYFIRGSTVFLFDLVRTNIYEGKITPMASATVGFTNYAGQLQKPRWPSSQVKPQAPVPSTISVCSLREFTHYLPQGNPKAKTSQPIKQWWRHSTPLV